ncbi:MAG: CHAT domain-containing protein [bacterium]|nr:CHAT domain-containing protein [bacterium]
MLRPRRALWALPGAAAFLVVLAVGLRIAMSRGADSEAPLAQHDANLTTETEVMTQPPSRIEPGVPITATMPGGGKHVFDLSLESGRYVEVTAEQLGIDVALEVFSPQGEKLGDCDHPSGRYGPELVSIFTEEAGDYRVEVGSSDSGVPAGDYRLLAEESSAAAETAGGLIAAERRFGEGEQLRRQRSWAEALAAYEEALAEWQAVDSPRQAEAWHRIGWMRQRLHDYLGASAAGEEALAIFRRHGNRLWEALTLHRLSNAYYRLAQNEKSLSAAEQAQAIFQSLDAPELELVVLQDLGKAYDRKGAMQQALHAYDMALDRARTMNDEMEEANALYGKGTVLTKHGEYPLALDALSAALQIFEARELSPRIGATLNRIGTVYFRLDDKTNALDYLERALEVRRQSQDRRGEAVTLSSLGTVHLESGEHDQAIERYRRALELYRETQDRHGEAGALLNIGRYHHEREELDEALASYEEALGIHLELDDPAGEASVRYLIARVLADREEYAEAHQQLVLVREEVESLRSRVDSTNLRTAYFATKQHYFSLHVEVLVRLHDADKTAGYDVQALLMHERRRARGLLDLLTEANADLRRDIDPSLIEEERDLRDRVNSKARELRRNPSEEIEQEQRALLGELDEVRTRIKQKNPQYAELHAIMPSIEELPKKVGDIRQWIRDIQKRVLDRRSLLLVYSLGEKRSFLWSISHDGEPGVYHLPPRGEIEKAARNTHDGWSHRSSRARRRGEEWSRKLSEMVLGPLVGRLTDQRLLIVADGALQYVPFAALPIPEAAKETNGAREEKLLIENHQIVHLPSISVVTALREAFGDRGLAPRRIAVVADPVFHLNDERLRDSADTGDEGPAKQAGEGNTSGRSALDRSAHEVGLEEFARLESTAEEAAEIRRLLEDPTQRFEALGFDATRELILSRELKRYRILHLATHGILNDIHPDLSGLVLSLYDEHRNPRDGFLRAHELYHLDLLAELVVLSACKTGLGEEVEGEGLVGLVRGFMYAGAPRLVVSLWDVSDKSTAELMKRFYRYLFGKAEDSPRPLLPAAALRAAQLSMLRDTDRSLPFYWAGFVFLGEWRGLGPSGDVPIEPPEPAELSDEHDYDAPVPGTEEETR